MPDISNANIPPVSTAKQRGTALVMTAIIILILGISMSGMLYSIQLTSRETREQETLIKMSRITHALSVYLQKYSRLPCPANPDTSDIVPPYGSERGSGATGTALGSCAGGLTDGIVPYKTLGLAEDSIKDGWGRYFTYHMNETTAFSAADAAAIIAANPNIKVHDVCRVKDVWVDRGGLANNWYPQQALACCVQPGSSGQIAIVNASGIDASGSIVPYYPSDYQPQHAPAPPPSINHTQLYSPIAMVLISHGVNGAGAYTGTGTNNRTSTTGLSAAEINNTDGNTGDRSFTDMPRTESLTNYFDDFVVFKTLPGVFSDVGNNNTGLCSFRAGCPPVPVSGAMTNAFTPSPMTDLTGVACP